MFSRELVKLTSFTYVRLRRNSVAFTILLARMLSNSMVSLPWYFADSPPSHPLELKTCGGNSLLMSNKLSLSIVFEALCAAEWMNYGSYKIVFTNIFTMKWFIDLACLFFFLIYFMFLAPFFPLLLSADILFSFRFTVQLALNTTNFDEDKCLSQVTKERIINPSHLSIIEIIDKFSWWCWTSSAAISQFYEKLSVLSRTATIIFTLQIAQLFFRMLLRSFAHSHVPHSFFSFILFWAFSPTCIFFDLFHLSHEAVSRATFHHQNYHRIIKMRNNSLSTDRNTLTENFLSAHELHMLQNPQQNIKGSFVIQASPKLFFLSFFFFWHIRTVPR